MKHQRYITIWRKPAPNILDWDHHISEDIEEVGRVVANLKQQGIRQYSTRPIGERVAEHSSEF